MSLNNRYEIPDFTKWKTILEDESPETEIVRFPMIVTQHRNPETENPIKRLNMKSEDELFDRKTPDELEEPIRKNLPVLNHLSAQEADSKTMMDRMLKLNLVETSQIYNKPAEKEKVSDKVVFHKLFMGADFVPKTVFSKSDLDDLKFPVIAKPSSERSGTGLVKLDKKEDADKFKNVKFDLFSECIDIAQEYRCFCFKDSVIQLDERIGNDEFLDDPETKTEFAYKKIEDFGKQGDLDKLITEARKKVKLDYFSLDFAVDEDGKLWLIEMNSNTGIGVEKQCKLYMKIYKDFYKKDVPSDVQKILDNKIAQYSKAYKEERLDECTIVASKIDGNVYLFKNRDRSFTPNNKVVHEKIGGVEVAYYTDQTGWIEGMNEFGIGFVFASTEGSNYEGYDKAYRVTDHPKRNSKKLFAPFAKEFRSLLRSKTLDEAIKKLATQKKSGNFLLSDGKKAYEFERFEKQSDGKKLSLGDGESFIKTNHGTLIAKAGQQYNPKQIKRASSDIRMSQAKLQLIGVKDPMDIPSRLQFQQFDPSSSLNTFRTDDEELTISQCLMKLKEKEFHFYHNEETANSVKIEDKMKDGQILVVVHK